MERVVGLVFLILREKKKLFNRIIKTILNNNIECRSIIGGDFLSHEYHKYFKIKEFYEVSNHIHNYGFMVGNYEKLRKRNSYLYKT